MVRRLVRQDGKTCPILFSDLHSSFLRCDLFSGVEFYHATGLIYPDWLAIYCAESFDARGHKLAGCWRRDFV